MSAPAVTRSLRISPAELKKQMDSHQPVTILDARSEKDYGESDQRIRGDIRIDPEDLHDLPELPKDRPTMVYCT
jgi:rhodanese-related sulfurtransferase